MSFSIELSFWFVSLSVAAGEGDVRSWLVFRSTSVSLEFASRWAVDQAPYFIMGNRASRSAGDRIMRGKPSGQDS